MKLQLGEIRNMKDPMTVLLEKDVPIKLAWDLTKLVKKFDSELNEIEEFRVKLVKKLGSVNDDGEIQVPEDKMEAFVKEFNELLITEIEVEFNPIDINAIGDLQMNTKDIMVLDKLFK